MFFLMLILCITTANRKNKGETGKQEVDLRWIVRQVFGSLTESGCIHVVLQKSIVCKIIFMSSTFASSINHYFGFRKVLVYERPCILLVGSCNDSM